MIERKCCLKIQMYNGDIITSLNSTYKIFSNKANTWAFFLKFVLHISHSVKLVIYCTIYLAQKQ